MRKILVLFSCLSILLMSPGTIIVNAMESSSTTEGSTCPLPRDSGTEEDEEFIKFIENEYGISRNDENVFVQYNANGTVSVIIIDSDKQFTIYTSPTEEQKKELANYNENSKGILWTAFVWLWNAIGAVETGCEIIQGVSGEDVCGYISSEVIKSLVQAGQRKKFKVFRSVEKKPCPYPPSSQQCNEPPYAYYKTVCQEY